MIFAIKIIQSGAWNHKVPLLMVKYFVIHFLGKSIRTELTPIIDSFLPLFEEKKKISKNPKPPYFFKSA